MKKEKTFLSFKRAAAFGTVLTLCALPLGCQKASGSEGDALAAYDRFLSRDAIPWNGGEEVDVLAAQFMTADLNSDKIPELLIRLPHSLYGSIGIFTYRPAKDGIDDISYCDEINGYYPGSRVFEATSVSKKDDGTVISTTELYNYLPDVTDETAESDFIPWTLAVGFHENHNSRGDNYYWQGIYTKEKQDEWAAGSIDPVAKETFEAQLAELTDGAEKEALPDEWADNTPENRKNKLN